VLGFFLDPGVEITDILNNPFQGLNTEERLATVFFTWLKYLGLLIFPHPLVHDYYPYAIPISTFSDAVVWISILLHLGLLAWGLWAGLIKKRWDGFAILFYFITFSIVSNLLFTVGTFMNERFIYISSLGFCMLFAYGLTQGARHFLSPNAARVTVALIVASLLAAYTWKTYDRLPDWGSYVSLNSSAVEYYPTSARSTLFMGTALFNEAMAMSDPQQKLKTLKEAEDWIDKSLAVFPTYGNQNTRTFKYYNAYKMKAGVASEIYKLERQLQPLLDVFLFVGKDKPHIPYLLEFLTYINRRSPDKARMEDFYHRLAYQELAVKQQKLNFAMNYLEKGLEYMPNSARLLYDKGRIYQMAGQQAEAQRFMNQARAIDPQIDARG
jgi:tetratricopeptide (TPR) repeat protein